MRAAYPTQTSTLLRELLRSREVTDLKFWEPSSVLHQDEEMLAGAIWLAGNTQRFSYANGPRHSLPKGAQSLLAWMKRVQKRKLIGRKNAPASGCAFPLQYQSATQP